MGAGDWEEMVEARGAGGGIGRTERTREGSVVVRGSRRGMGAERGPRKEQVETRGAGGYIGSGGGQERGVVRG